jgi:hypothetical protein
MEENGFRKWRDANIARQHGAESPAVFCSGDGCAKLAVSPVLQWLLAAIAVINIFVMAVMRNYPSIAGEPKPDPKCGVFSCTFLFNVIEMAKEIQLLSALRCAGQS